MREIKFRQWDEELQAMSEPFSIGHICKYKGVHFKSYNPDKPTMQFTGLLDRNGKEIYEGDVVQVSGYGKMIIEWPFDLIYEAQHENDIETIIGNIHENPELLSC